MGLAIASADLMAGRYGGYRMDVGKNWLHGRHFSALAYAPALIVGSYTGVMGFVLVMYLNEESIFSSETLNVPIVAWGIYLKLLDYFMLSLSLSSIALVPATFALLFMSRNWRLGSILKYALLGLPVAALFAAGQMIFWRDEVGGTLAELPVGTAAAITMGGIIGGLVYLGVASVLGLSHRHGGAST